MEIVAEGLIDDQDDYDSSSNKGISVIDYLRNHCLLEVGAREGTINMHDVVRDVAIWISSSLETGYQSLVRSGIGLTHLPERTMTGLSEGSLS